MPPTTQARCVGRTEAESSTISVPAGTYRFAGAQQAGGRSAQSAATGDALDDEDEGEDEGEDDEIDGYLSAPRRTEGTLGSAPAQSAPYPGSLASGSAAYEPRAKEAAAASQTSAHEAVSPPARTVAAQTLGGAPPRLEP